MFPTRSLQSINFLTKAILKRPGAIKWAYPLSCWYAEKMGYMQLGLRYDDLLPEESEVMQLALKRLPPKEAYDRVFRLRRAFQLSLSHQLLPRDQWTKHDEDIAYLQPIVDEIEAEMKEKEDLDSMIVKKLPEQSQGSKPAVAGSH